MTAPWGIEALGLFALCWLLARLEIEIEGDRGWAESLPTWRWGPPWLLRLTNAKPVTGYHVFMSGLLLGFFHWPMAWTGWSMELEAAALSRYLLMTVTWDFQWFVWNPAWGVRRFLGEPSWWFPRRVLGFPVEYPAAYAASGLIQALAWPAGLGRWAMVAGGLIALSAAVTLVSPSCQRR